MQAVQPLKAPWIITNVVPGDYDYDGRLDLLLMGEDNPGGWFTDNELKLMFYRGRGGGNFSKLDYAFSQRLGARRCNLNGMHCC